MFNKIILSFFALFALIVIVESQDTPVRDPVTGVLIDANLTVDALFVDEMPWLQFPPSRCGAIKFKWTNWCLNADDYTWTNVYPIRIKYMDCRALPACPFLQCPLDFSIDADAKSVSYPFVFPYRPRCVTSGYYRVNALKFDCNQDPASWKKVTCLIPYRCSCICLYDNLDVIRDY